QGIVASATVLSDMIRTNGSRGSCPSGSIRFARSLGSPALRLGYAVLMRTEMTTVRSILTRTSGYLETVCSHSLQPYRGCPFGASLCGVGCYVQHSLHVTRGRRWGSFLEVRTDAAESYRAGYERERRWARERRDGFVIFLSSAT